MLIIFGVDYKWVKWLFLDFKMPANGDTPAVWNGDTPTVWL